MRILYFIQRYYISLFFVCIICFGVFLRYYNYQTVPRLGSTFDEFAWTWLGVNLIEKGIPASWSPHPQYKIRQHVEYLGAKFFVVQPYLEHPPLFGLVAGGFAKLRGVTGMFTVTLQKIRPLALIISFYTLIAFCIFLWQVYGKNVAFYSLLIYASMPTAVIGSRIIQNENFLIALWITTLIFLFQYLQTKKLKYLLVAAFFCGIAPLAKVPWLIVGFSSAVVLLYKSNWRSAFILLGVTLGFFLLFLVYGFVLDAELFVKLWALQLARYDIHFHGMFSLFTQPLLVDRWYVDGWVYFGWFAFFLIMGSLKKYFLLIIPVISYLVLFVFAIPDEPMHGWYRYPFLPFLSASIGIFVTEEFKQVTLQRLFFFLVVGLSLLGLTWGSNYGFSLSLYRSYILLCCGITFAPLWFKQFRGISNPSLVFWLMCMFLLNSWAVFRYSDI